MTIPINQVHWHNGSSIHCTVMTMHSSELTIPAFGPPGEVKGCVNRVVVAPGATYVYQPDKTWVTNIDKVWGIAELGLTAAASLAIYLLSDGAAAPAVDAVDDAIEAGLVDADAAGEASATATEISDEDQASMFERISNIPWLRYANVAKPFIQGGLVVFGGALVSIKGEFEFYFCESSKDIWGNYVFPNTAVGGGMGNATVGGGTPHPPWNVCTSLTWDNGTVHLFMADGGNVGFSPTDFVG